MFPSHWLAAALLLGSGIATAQTTPPNEWENPQAVDQHKEPARASFMLFDKVADVAADDYTRSPYYASLNGTWKFHYVPRPAERPPDFF